jgi:DNA-binding response OmpR family regulator
VSRVLVVEDDASIRESLCDFFGARGHVVDACALCAEAEALLAGERFTVVLLDLRLPDGDGLDLLRGLRRRGDRTPVIVLTARGEVEQRVRGLSAGADDYLVKPYSLDELDARVHALLRRAGSEACTVRLGDAEVDLDGHVVRRGGVEHRLLPKEAELLAHLLRHRGVTQSRDQLLTAVWGYDATPTTRTVDTHVFNLRKKLERDPARPELLLTVHGVGYRLGGS